MANKKIVIKTNSMIKKILIGFGIWVVILLVLFAAFAFGNWDINPQKWDSFARGIFSILSFIAAVISIPITIEITE